MPILQTNKNKNRKNAKSKHFNGKTDNIERDARFVMCIEMFYSGVRRLCENVLR